MLNCRINILSIPEVFYVVNGKGESMKNVIRYRHIIRHDTPKSRTITDEFTISNESDVEITSIMLIFKNDPVKPNDIYRPNLHIFEADGTELTFLPTDELLSELEKSNETWFKNLLEAIKDKQISVLAIDFPSDNPLPIKSKRIITLVYMDKERPQIPRFYLMSIPRFTITLHPPIMTERFSTHVVVIPPQEYEVELRSASPKALVDNSLKDLSEKDGYYRTVSSRVVDLTLPTGKLDIRFSGEYRILPDRAEKWLFRSFSASVIVASVFVFLATLNLFKSLWILSYTEPIIDAHRTVMGQSFLILSVGFIGLVTNSLTHRTKLWLLIPIFLSILILLIP